MTEIGYPQFFMTEAMIKGESRMPATCSDCHLGDPTASSLPAAHKGLLSVKVADSKFRVRERGALNTAEREAWRELAPSGENRATQLLPKIEADGRLKDLGDYNLVLWQDKNPETLAFNPVIAEKTCGRCHEGVVGKFLKSPMGGAEGGHVQSQYRAWTGPAGPQSCGLWTGPLAQPAQERFTDVNQIYYNAHSTAPISEKTAFNNQRTCNRCHVGCLDCHLDISRKEGGEARTTAHTFVKKPAALACYGGGRGFICHAGPLERRRGDGFISGEFTQAAKKGRLLLKERPDVHYLKGIVCVDCHEPNNDGGAHADLRRNVSCGKCHAATVAAHAAGPHKNVDCAACHTSLIGGYAFNFWTAVGSGSNSNPIKRIQDYLVDAIPPLLVKNPKGAWIPVHVVPHTSGNVRADEVKLSGQLVFRDRPYAGIDRRYFSNDSYAITGLVKDPDANDHDIMVWLNLDRVAHATGKSRGCIDCHASRVQRIEVPFEGGSYKDLGDGKYTIVADEKGLRVTGFKGPGGETVPKELVPFRDKWHLGGDFRLPAIRDVALYGKLEAAYKKGTFSH